MRSLILLLWCSMALTANAQVSLFKANLDRQCVFTGGIMDNELYQYSDNSAVPQWVAEILDLTGEISNFELVEASVENISAVVDSTRRYLLYSIDFIEKTDNPVAIYGALAHEVGHHINNHTLLPENRLREEWEADNYMGYFLSKRGFSRDAVAAFTQQLPSSYATLGAQRTEAAMEGFDKAERALRYKSLAINNDPGAEKYQLPGFEFKRCYTSTEIPRTKFAGMTTLGKVDEKIRLVLDTRGYYNRSYFSVKNGFAITCQLEQYNRQNAAIRNDRTRWLDYPVRDNFSGLFDYLSAVVIPNKGYFRLFVIVVTDQPFSAAQQQVSKAEAAEWLSRGGNRLPDDIKKSTFSNAHYVSALVYEFEVPQSNHQPRQVCPAPLHDAATHLRQSGLGAGFGL